MQEALWSDFLDIIKDILYKTIQNLSINKKFKAQMAIAHWEEIVGKDIAAQTNPQMMDFGILNIAVKNSVWAHHLMMMKMELLHKINEFIGEPIVRDIRFNQRYTAINRPISADKNEPDFGRALKRIYLTENEVNQADIMVRDVENDELKSKLKRLVSRHLASKKLKLTYKWHKCGKCNSLCDEKDRLCHVCNLQEKKQRYSDIRSILLEVPWATYGEVYKHVPCSNAEYIDAKVTLLNVIAQRIEDEVRDRMDVLTLVMLFTGAKYDEVNEKIIEKTMYKFRSWDKKFSGKMNGKKKVRGNQYVSTSGI